MNLYQFSALISVDVVIAANNETSAQKEINALSAEGFVANGEIIGYAENPSLGEIRKSKGNDTIEQLLDEANIIADFTKRPEVKSD
jgi:hypothetical protein